MYLLLSVEVSFPVNLDDLKEIMAFEKYQCGLQVDLKRKWTIYVVLGQGGELWKV